MIKNCKIGKNVKIPHPDLVNLYGCEIGSGSFVGPFVEITAGVIIGRNCRIQSHSFICGGVTIEDNVFIGHCATFTNDKFPKVNNKNFKLEKTHVSKGACIGSNATILPVNIGKNSIIGAGAVITKNVPANSVVTSPEQVGKIRINHG
jgi:acetyltransferase-like isoleucine patch superfamily enzyme